MRRVLLENYPKPIKKLEDKDFNGTSNMKEILTNKVNEIVNNINDLIEILKFNQKNEK